MATATATATLVAHAGATKIQRGELLTLHTPPRTLTHTPVPHHALVDSIEERLNDFGMRVVQQEFAVANSGMRLFAALVLSHQTRSDFRFAMALRAANDRSMAIEIVAGLRVFVCDNMALSGEGEVLNRKHTGRLNIRHEINGGVERAVRRFASLETSVARLKQHRLSDVEAKALILDAATQEIMPLRLIPAVTQHYFEPPHQEFKERTAWSLHNAFTESFKELRPNVALDATQELGKLLAL